MLVDSAQAFKRKGGDLQTALKGATVYSIKKKQVIPQTGLSLCFELQRMFTTIKSNIVGNANYKKKKKKKITKEHLSHYLNAYCMLWNSGSELEVNFIMVYVWIYRKNILYIQKRCIKELHRKY